ncbi:protein of unknown function [Methanoculleus bourgensis]|uniref:Uncharacterized protein n=1 Tax=Methanoculleus bourgensis TaxID=83986 RepID=A0A0X3BLU8_9EURY|nr:protein of unknown function [Methanoculleus bourgensis]
MRGIVNTHGLRKATHGKHLSPVSRPGELSESATHLIVGGDEHQNRHRASRELEVYAIFF